MNGLQEAFFIHTRMHAVSRGVIRMPVASRGGQGGMKNVTSRAQMAHPPCRRPTA